jgi:transcriptional regulator with XRE-family HTH domain
MKSTNPLLMPALLFAERQQRGLSQKTVAVAAELNQSTLCAFEKGRRLPPGPDVMSRLVSALGMGPEEAEQLSWAARHDQLINQLSELRLQDAAMLVSAAVRSARLLAPEEATGLLEQMESILKAKEALTRLQKPRSSPSPRQEAEPIDP